MKFLKMNDRARAEEGYNYYVDMMPVMPYASAAGGTGGVAVFGRRAAESGDGEFGRILRQRFSIKDQG